MKLSELAAEVSDSPAEQQDYEVVVEYPESIEQGYLDTRSLRWDHQDKRVVIEV